MPRKIDPQLKKEINEVIETSVDEEEKSEPMTVFQTGGIYRVNIPSTFAIAYHKEIEEKKLKLVFRLKREKGKRHAYKLTAESVVDEK